MSSDAAVARWVLTSFLLSCVVFVGCTSTHRVTGTVTYDGQPVKTGAIVFIPLEGDPSPRGTLIASGTYSVECQLGRHRIEIRGTRPLDEARVPRTRPRLGEVPVHEDYIPAAYNTASTLEVEVTDGPNVFTFDLQSP